MSRTGALKSKKIKCFIMKNENTIKKLGYKVRIVRVDKGYSQETLAEKANLNRSFVGLLERGETNITVKNLESIANALEVNIKELFDFTI
ncbi:MAG: helix-turn-helix transcriptional regulator [bacterium]|nr:helix-turn-helix transcriptional regulator [bacterium]